MFSNATRFYRDECDRALTKGIDGTGAMQVFGAYEDQQRFKKEAVDSGIIEYIGTWLSLSSANPVPEDFVRQRQANGSFVSNHTVWYYIDRSAMGAHNLHFAQSMDIPEEKWLDPQWNGVILGSSYRGISLGEIYELEIFDGSVLECEVIGILKKGEQIVSDLVMADGRGNGIYTMQFLDDAIIMPEQLYVSDRPKGAVNWVYTPAEGVSLKEARAFLAGRAKELGISVETAYLSDGFYAEEIEQRDIRRIEKESYLVLCLSCLLICICLRFLQVMENQKQIGIFYANGFSDADIIWIYAWQSILKILIAFIAAWVALKKFGEGFFDGPVIQENVIKSVNRWINSMALPQMICFGILLLVTCILIPFFIIRGKSPAELLTDARG